MFNNYYGAIIMVHRDKMKIAKLGMIVGLLVTIIVFPPTVYSEQKGGMLPSTETTGKTVRVGLSKWCEDCSFEYKAIGAYVSLEASPAFYIYLPSLFLKVYAPNGGHILVIGYIETPTGPEWIWVGRFSNATLIGLIGIILLPIFGNSVYFAGFAMYAEWEPPLFPMTTS